MLKYIFAFVLSVVFLNFVNIPSFAGNITNVSNTIQARETDEEKVRRCANQAATFCQFQIGSSYKLCVQVQVALCMKK